MKSIHLKDKTEFFESIFFVFVLCSTVLYAVLQINDKLPDDLMKNWKIIRIVVVIIAFAFISIKEFQHKEIELLDIFLLSCVPFLFDRNFHQYLLAFLLMMVFVVLTIIVTGLKNSVDKRNRIIKYLCLMFPLMAIAGYRIPEFFILVVGICRIHWSVPELEEVDEMMVENQEEVEPFEKKAKPGIYMLLSIIIIISIYYY